MMTEPSAEIRQLAQMYWQLYSALRQEGFDEEQAMSIVDAFIQANGT